MCCDKGDQGDKTKMDGDCGVLRAESVPNSCDRAVEENLVLQMETMNLSCPIEVCIEEARDLIESYILQEKANCLDQLDIRITDVNCHAFIDGNIVI